MTTIERRPLTAPHLKDAVLDQLAEDGNVAQFVSFEPGPDPSIRYIRIHGADSAGLPLPDHAVHALLERSVDRSVNVRSFRPEQPKSHEFIYGLKGSDEAMAAVRRLAGEGLYTIVNETIDIHDGGVSGVSYAGVLEFAPEDTPRCVEKSGIALFPRELGLRVLETVYGFPPQLPDNPALRVEFSIHPLKRGYRQEHTVLWEQERTEALRLPAEVAWPNHFSRFIGDKTHGLLVADALGVLVPATTAVTRKVAPFTFGQPTGSKEPWIRTAPIEQVPGKFTTRRGWTDPFELLAGEDPQGGAIAAVLSQEGVTARYSGAAAGTISQNVIVEGVSGFGEAFMQGAAAPERLPTTVAAAVRATYSVIADKLGPVRLEWVHDGEAVWVVQLHRGATPTDGRTIYPGRAAIEHPFEVDKGLDPLRELVARVENTGEGILLIGSAGVTSHLGDVLRRARIPSRIQALP